MKKIEFKYLNDGLKEWSLSPIPAIKELPEWYKKMNRFKGNDKKISASNSGKNLTMKACSPVFDSISAGYLICLSADVYVSQNENGPYFRWYVSEPLVEFHGNDQIPNMPIRKGYQKNLLKWINTHNIYTPSGYSLLFQHPAYREDLPFYSLSGIVDTDTFNYPVNFPFFIEEGYEGVIKKGTPIIQIIPIKRDHWVSKNGSVEENMNSKMQNLFSVLERFYRSNYWNKKRYE